MFQTQQRAAYAEGQQSPPPLRRPHHLAKPKMLRASDYLYRESPGIANHWHEHTTAKIERGKKLVSLSGAGRSARPVAQLAAEFAAADFAADGFGQFFDVMDLARVLVWRGNALDVILEFVS